MNEKTLAIRLITATPDEVERMHKNSSAFIFSNYNIAPEAVPPDIVLSSALERFRAGELWFWCAPRLFMLSSENLIIGSGCFKSSPRGGAVEIGCGVAESHRGRNFATEGVLLLVTEALSNSEVTVITAETAVWNIASQRILEKASFTRAGQKIDPEDGPLITWRRERGCPRSLDLG